MSEPWVPEFVVAEAQRRRRRRRKKFLLCAAVIVLTVLTSASLFFLRRYQSERALEDAIAETDLLDPGWRLDDLVKSQAALPAEVNAAVPISAAYALLAAWKIDPNDASKDIRFRPQVLFEQQRLAMLRKNRDPWLAARAEALKAIPLKTGRYPANLSLLFHDSAGGLTPNQVLHVGRYLQGLALLQCHDGNHDDAWQTNLAILAAARSLGDETLLMGVMVRCSLQGAAASNFERCLALGQVDDAALAEAMKALADEASVPLRFNALRCERAAVHELLTRVEKGDLELDQVYPDASLSTGMLEIASAWLLAGGTLKGAHAWLLRFENEALAAAKLPHAAVVAKMKELEQKSKDEGPVWAVKKPLFDTGARFAQTRVWLDCAVAGLGVERFRLKHGHWPESLDEVVAAALLANVPADVYDGKALRFRKTTDGVVVFSIGQHGKGAGDSLDQGRQTPLSHQRFEFRLWDVNQRRQAPLPAIKNDGPPKA